MNDIAAVTESDTLDHLVDVVPKTFGVNTHSVFLEHFEQIFLNILENEIESPFPTQNK